MEPRGAPPRILTSKAREQIRYLHEEFPESWSVPRLAEALDVRSDVIRSVFKSKFVPTLEKTLKQDQKVLQKAGLAHLLCQLPGPGDAWELLCAGCPVSGAQASSQGHGQHRELQKYSTSGGEGTRVTDSDGFPSAKELEALKARELGEQNFSSKAPVIRAYHPLVTIDTQAGCSLRGW
ncbi:hypothetical protein QTO34_015000 [Cnephaeus nilssonii]|uniref:Neugrin n=1 Tax=Cnephaeus nilssonii TaxID=3371016 RepID=A0AA40H9S0_CNENI|nr:hypothetical protein QTO34_015000 [Eptesicus nilssonii]